MSTSQGQAGKLEKRQEILLEVIDSFSSTLERPTSSLLHECILLCRLQSKNLRYLRDYDFHAYIRGPFSEQLRADLEVLGHHRLIEVNDGRLMLSNLGKELTQKLKEKSYVQDVKAACDKVLAEFRSPHAISQGIDAFLSTAQVGELVSLP